MERPPRTDPAVAPEQFPDDDAYVRAILRRLVRDPHRVEDLAQDTWLAAMRQSGATRVAKRAWLGTVARNLVRQMSRSESRRQAREQRVARPLLDEPETADTEQLRRIRHSLAQLPEHYRTVVHLRFYEDLPPTMIADRLGIPIETARTRLRRGLAALHAVLVS